MYYRSLGVEGRGVNSWRGSRCRGECAHCCCGLLPPQEQELTSPSYFQPSSAAKLMFLYCTGQTAALAASEEDSYIFICIYLLFKTCNLLEKSKPICCLDVGILYITAIAPVCKCQYFLFESGIVLPSVVDRHRFDAYPDPTFHLKQIQIRIQILTQVWTCRKILIYFDFYSHQCQFLIFYLFAKSIKV